MSIVCRAFPANTLIRSSGTHSLAFGFGTFAYAKDRASLPLDGLLKENPTPCSHDLFGINDQICGGYGPSQKIEINALVTVNFQLIYRY